MTTMLAPKMGMMNTRPPHGPLKLRREAHNQIEQISRRFDLKKNQVVYRLLWWFSQQPVSVQKDIMLAYRGPDDEEEN